MISKTRFSNEQNCRNRQSTYFWSHYSLLTFIPFSLAFSSFFKNFSKQKISGRQNQSFKNVPVPQRDKSYQFDSSIDDEILQLFLNIVLIQTLTANIVIVVFKHFRSGYV